MADSRGYALPQNERRTLRITPALAAGVADHVWEVEDIVALLEEQEADYKGKKGDRMERRYSPFGPVLGHWRKWYKSIQMSTFRKNPTF